MGLVDVDGLGEVTGAPRQQRSLRRMCQVLSWALAPSPGRGAGRKRGWRTSWRLMGMCSRFTPGPWTLEEIY